MKLISFFLVGLFSLGHIPFYGQTLKIEKKATFSIKKGINTINGQFDKIDYTIKLNNDGLGNIYGAVDISTISTANSTRDKHLQNKEWFDAANYPKITVQSQRIIKNPKGAYVGTFEITIKGKSRIIEIPFQIIKHLNGKKFQTTFDLSLKDFNIGGGLVNWIVGDKVTVMISLDF